MPDKNSEEYKLLESILGSIDSAFRLMNWYASNEHMKNWNRTDPQAILGDVYLRLAPVSLGIHEYFDKNENKIEEACHARLGKHVRKRTHIIKRRNSNWHRRHKIMVRNC